jgi:hypothetical protein
LSHILRANPNLQGIVFDRPGVARQAQDLIEAADLQNRCSFVGGSFFETVPSGGDTYILSHILHDWPDEEAVNILASCRRAMGGTSKLLVIEHLLSERESEAPFPYDMLLLGNTAGRLRAIDEHRALLERAAFTLTDRYPCARGVTILEAAPA